MLPEIGTGSGYQTAILARLGRRVFTIERHRELLQEAQAVLDGLRLTNIVFRFGDGTKGWPEQLPYDRVIVTAAAAEVPAALVDGLAPAACAGGVPVGADRRDQQLDSHPPHRRQIHHRRPGPGPLCPARRRPAPPNRYKRLTWFRDRTLTIRCGLCVSGGVRGRWKKTIGGGADRGGGGPARGHCVAARGLRTAQHGDRHAAGHRRPTTAAGANSGAARPDLVGDRARLSCSDAFSCWRMRITSPPPSAHPHLAGAGHPGRRRSRTPRAVGWRWPEPMAMGWEPTSAPPSAVSAKRRSNRSRRTRGCSPAWGIGRSRSAPRAPSAAACLCQFDGGRRAARNGAVAATASAAPHPNHPPPPGAFARRPQPPVETAVSLALSARRRPRRRLRPLRHARSDGGRRSRRPRRAPAAPSNGRCAAMSLEGLWCRDRTVHPSTTASTRRPHPAAPAVLATDSGVVAYSESNELREGYGQPDPD